MNKNEKNANLSNDSIKKTATHLYHANTARMQLGLATVVARSSLPHTEIRSTVGAFDVENQILNESYLVDRVDNLINRKNFA